MANTLTLESTRTNPDLAAPCLPLPLLMDPDAAPLLAAPGGRDAWTGRFGLGADNLPTPEFAEAVWQALVHYGRELPPGERPLPPRPWQPAELMLLLEHPRASLQGARQGAGKTFVAALVVACHLLLGSAVTIALPTYRQGHGILAARVLRFMALLEAPLGLRRTRCNAHESAWDNGARLLTLSTSSGGRRGTQGWTCRVVVIDESHELAYSELAWFMPLLALAHKQRAARLLLLGVGAAAGRAPQRARELPEFASLVLDDVTLSELDKLHRARLKPDDPELEELSWREFFAEEREVCDEDYYRQFYMCQSPGSARRKLFDRVPEAVEDAVLHVARGTGALARQYATGSTMTGESARPTVSPSQIYLGVDVGKQRDQTVVAVLEQLGSVYNLVDCIRLPLGMAYTEQARELAALARQWGCPPGRFTVEVNGPGQALYDLLADPLAPAVWHATPLHMTPQLKAQALARLASDARRGRFGVARIPLRGSRVSESGLVGTGLALSGGADILVRHPSRAGMPAPPEDRLNAVPTWNPYLGPTIRDHLAGLLVYYSDDGVMQAEHSDVLSALVAARCAMDELRTV